MFERFTNRARQVVVRAQEEARLLRHNYIGTEHLLLGLLANGEGTAARALNDLGVTLDGARQKVVDIVGVGQQPAQVSGHIPFKSSAKKVLELSLREALQLGHNYIGTEHILLGLIREGDDVAVQVLASLGKDLTAVRAHVISFAPPPGGLPGATAIPAAGARVAERLSSGRRSGIVAALEDISAAGEHRGASRYREARWRHRDDRRC